MKRVLKYFFLLLTAIVVLGFVAGAWLIHDGDWIRDKAGEYVSGLTGRQFSIDGPLDIDLSLHPVISARDLRLENASWAGDTDLVRLKKLRFSIDFLSLFSDQVAFDFIELEGLELALAENDQGDVNWDLFPPGEQETKDQDADEEPMDDLPVRADRLVLKDIHVSLSAPDRAKPLDFVLLEFEAERNDDGLAMATAHGSLEDLPLAFSGRAGPLKHLIIGGGMEAKIDLSLGEIDFNLEGKVADSLTGQGANVTINFSGPDIAWVTREFALPEFTQGAFDFDLKLNTGDYDTELILVGDLGHLDVNASGKVDDFRRPREGEVKFEITGPDLQSLGEALGEPKLAPVPYHLKGDVSAHLGLVEIHTFQFEVGENTGQAVGKMGEWPDLSGTELHVSVSGPDLSQWGPVLHLEGLTAQAFSFTGHLGLSASGLGFKVTGSVAHSKFDFDALLTFEEKFTGSHIEFEVSGPDFRPFLDIDALAPLPGEFRASGRIEKGAGEDQLKGLELDLGNMWVRVNGTVDDLTQLTSADLVASISLPSLSELDGFMDQDFPDFPFSMEVSFSGTASQFTLDPLQARLGPSDLSAKISMDLEEDPLIEGQISSDFLDLAWLTAPDEGKEAATKPDGRVFPDEPIPYREYGRAKIDLDLSVERLKLDYTELTGVRLDLSLHPDYFRVNSFEFGGPLGETVSGSLSISGGENETQLEFQVEGDELRLGLASAEEQDASTYPPTSISMGISGKGATWRQLVSSLDGQIRIVQGEGLIANAGLELLFSDLLSELFNTLNPFAKKSVYTGLDCAVVNAKITSGTVLIDPFIFHTEQITILSGGLIDLETEKMNLEFQTKVRKGIGISAGMVINPFIKLGGTLATPNIELDPAGAAFSGSVAVATAGLSIIGKSLFDRFLGNRDPCGEALKKLNEADNRP